MYLETKSGKVTIPQVSNFGLVPNLGTADYVRTGNELFVIKNDNAEAVILEVMPSEGDAYVSTSFAPGWNAEIVKAIKTNTTLTAPELALILWGI